MSRVSDPPGAVVAHDHSHVPPQFVDKGVDEAKLAILVMGDHDVSCNNLGSHRHGRDQERHHHHDLACLIEAGANTVRPQLVEAIQHAENLNGMITRLHDSERMLSLQRDEALRQRDILKADIQQMLRFMQHSTARGPWATVYDQYLDWVIEEAMEPPQEPQKP